MNERFVNKTLLDTYLPDYQFSERHATWINASPRDVLDVIMDYDFTADSFTAALIALRRLPGRVLGKALPHVAMPEDFTMRTFTPLARDGDKEMAAGLVGRFWRLDGGLVPITDADAFAAYAAPGVPKLVMNFAAEPDGVGTRLSTETRVYCPDRISRVRFTPYWYAIRLASGLIRRRFLSRIRARFD
jgi:hypothetical protein